MAIVDQVCIALYCEQYTTHMQYTTRAKDVGLRTSPIKFAEVRYYYQNCRASCPTKKTICPTKKQYVKLCYGKQNKKETRNIFTGYQTLDAAVPASSKIN